MVLSYLIFLLKTLKTNIVKIMYNVPYFGDEKSFINFNSVLLYSYFLEGGNTKNDIEKTKIKLDRFEKDNMVENTLNSVSITDNIIKIAMDECYNLIKIKFNKEVKNIPNKDSIIQFWKENLHSPSDHMIAIYSMVKYTRYILIQF